MTQTAETAWIAVALFVCWAVATALGLGVGAVVVRRRGSALMMTVGGVLGSVGSSVAPITAGFCDRGDAGHWGIVTTSLAVIGSFTGSLAGAHVGRGIVAASLAGARSGCASGGAMGVCFAGFLIAMERGHPYAFIAAPVFILLAVAIGTAYGMLFSLLFAFGWRMIRGPSADPRAANDTPPQAELPSV